MVIGVFVYSIVSPKELTKDEYKELKFYELSAPRQLTDFRLKSGSNVFKQTNLLEKWHLVFMGFASCPDMCPMTMAKMKKASILIQKKQILRGLEIYEDLEKTAFDQSFKDMSTILFVLNAIDHRPSEILLNKIERLTTNSSWKFSALELKGFILLKEKKLSESKKTFNTIIEMGNAPTTLASRARDMVDFLEGK